MLGVIECEVVFVCEVDCFCIVCMCVYVELFVVKWFVVL